MHYGTHVMQLCIFKQIKRLCNNCMSKMYAYSNSNRIYSRKRLYVSRNKPLVQLKDLSREEQRVGYYLAAHLETTLEEEMYLTMEEM